jgi:hypothetical protein
MRYKKINLLIIFLLAVGMMNISFAEGKGSNKSLRKTTAGSGDYYKMNINNISTYIYNNGIADVIGSDAGFIYPKGSNKGAIYQSGFLWGGKDQGSGGKIFVGGATFTTNVVPGKIGQDPNSARMFRVRPDYATGSMLSEINDGEGSEADIREKYKSDWMDWPWQDGAPYFDANNDGKYDPDPDGNGKYDAGEDIPGIPGASQTIFYIGNTTNPDESRKFYGSFPVPIELHVTVWAYSTVGPLSNMIFKKYVFINKGTSDITDMYCSAWNDPDNGNAGDDFVGVDSTLGMGYCYNAFATDQVYGSTPPATAFDFFQGPVVPGEATDEAKSMGRKLKGYKNLNATAFYYFVNENNTIYSDPDLDDYATGTLYFYNLLQGKIGATGEEFPIPEQLGGGHTHFPLSGDPVTQTGYIDGIIKPAADRRYGLASGPFTLAAGDTQEVVIAEMVAGATSGVDNLGALKLLRTYDAKAQDAYDKDFQLPAPPAAPILKTTALNQEIILDWGDDLTAVKATESYNKEGYSFQGYNVYQLPSASATKEDAVRIATFDIVDGVKSIIGEYNDPQTGALLTRVEQFGNDTGIKRYLRITNDYINNRTLINGTKYFYAVTSYSYSSDPLNVPNNLENPLAILTVTPQSPDPGVRYDSEYGATLKVTKNGTSDGSCEVVVIDPSKVTGHNYKVEFYNDAKGNPVWKLTDVTSGVVKLTDISNQSGDDSYPVVDGLMVKVKGAAEGLKAAQGGIVEIKYAGQPVATDALGAAFGGNNVWHSLNSAQPQRYFISGGGGDGDVDRLERYAKYLFGRDFELRFTDAGGYGVYGFTDDKICTTPFELWDIGVNTPNDASDDHRMIPVINENDVTKAAWGVNTGTDAYFGQYGISDWIYWLDPLDTSSPTAGYDKFAAACVASGGPGSTYNYPADDVTGYYMNDYNTGFIYPIGRVVIGDYDGDGNPPPSGTVIRFNTNKPNSSAVNFSFTAPTVTKSEELAKEDVEKVNVFPNPYYGANPQELNKYQRFVTFTHLPKNAVIRIFNLAGQLVKTINKTSDSQFEKWDLLNESALPVASGLYIAYIEMPDLGKTKILKLAIVQEQQILDRF